MKFIMHAFSDLNKRHSCAAGITLALKSQKPVGLVGYTGQKFAAQNHTDEKEGQNTTSAGFQ